MPDRNNGNNSALIYAFHEANQDLRSEPNTPAANILRSVREQEAQFEKLTRELEVERRTVADQLDRVRYGSETASLKSISTTDDSFSWRRSAQNESSHLADESSIDDNRPNSQLIDSCLRALGNPAIMDYSTSYTNGPDPHYGSTMYDSPSMNGTGSPRPSSRQNGGYSPAVGTPTKNYQTYDYDPQQGYQDGYQDDRYQQSYHDRPPSIDGSDQYQGERYDTRAPPSPHGSDQYGAAPRAGVTQTHIEIHREIHMMMVEPMQEEIGTQEEVKRR
ncbi:uncharacterized protein [Amphiura filiformis]|uniref:uncharacterized protein isoform X2 n=1 Tax=Amphiura filiformis TaxID=82378 RepID=UPI003B20F7D1